MSLARVATFAVGAVFVVAIAGPAWPTRALLLVGYAVGWFMPEILAASRWLARSFGEWMAR